MPDTPIPFTADDLTKAVNNSSPIDLEAKYLLANHTPATEQIISNQLPRDSEWVRQAFILGTFSVSRNGQVSVNPNAGAQLIRNRSFTSAILKHTDSTFGGSVYINPPPQFTRYADIHFKGIRNDGVEVTVEPPPPNSSIGQGRVWSEMIDDNAQVIHLRFGLPAYNSLTQFFTGFYSGKMAAAARQGRFTEDVVHSLSTMVGNAVGLAIAPLFVVPLAFMLAAEVGRYFTNSPSSKFYTMVPKMPMYWHTVSNLLNQHMMNSGLSTNIDTDASSAFKARSGAQTYGAVASFLPPGSVTPEGNFDIFKIVTRASRMQTTYDNIMKNLFESGSNGADLTGNDYSQLVLNAYKNMQNINYQPIGNNLAAYLNNAISAAKDFFTIDPNSKEDGIETDPRIPKSEAKQPTQGVTPGEGKTASTQSDANTVPDSAAPVPSGHVLYDKTKVPAGNEGFLEYLVNAFNDGAEFLSYRVDYTGSVTESFSNSTSGSSLADKINSMSSRNREIRINAADGNIGMGIGTVLKALTGVVNGAAEILHFDGLAAVAGSAFVDIPEHWDQSIASLPTATYTMTLISPYGNPISQLFNIYGPLMPLLAGALPLATGKQSHTSPYLVELHDRGRCMTRLGIISSLTITRGTSNLGFNNDGKPLAIEVSFTVKDLSSIVAMPVMPDFNLSAAISDLFDNDNSFTDYMMTLSGMSLRDTIYRWPMFKYNYARLKANWESFKSPAHIAQWISSLPGINLATAAFRGTVIK